MAALLFQSSLSISSGVVRSIPLASRTPETFDVARNIARPIRTSGEARYGDSASCLPVARR
eukprot:7188660-Alexandrium_andersonii.AAC.1